MEKIDRVQSGIKELDELILGGFPKNSTTLVTGGPGAGKTTFCLNFLVNGALKYKEPGVYISLEEDPKRIIHIIKSSFSWPIDSLIREKFIQIEKVELYDFNKLKTMIEDIIDMAKAKRLVIDPLTIMSLYFEKPLEIRRSIVELDRMLKKSGCTTLITCEIPEGDVGISSFGIEEFVADGIIVLNCTQGKNMLFRTLLIRKMRMTKHSTGIYPIEITRNGVTFITNRNTSFYDHINKRY